MATENQNLSDFSIPYISDISDFKFAIVVSEWNQNITSNLLKGAKEALLKAGVQEKNITILDVPGSFELVYGSSILQSKNFDGILALGSVIRGETSHFDYVCSAVSNGISDLNTKEGLPPIIFGLLTDDTLQQAIDRSGGKHGNKGFECAVATLKMAKIFRDSKL